MQQPTEPLGLASKKLALVVGVCATEIGANLFFEDIKFSSVQDTFDDGIAIIPYLFRNVMVLRHLSLLDGDNIWIECYRETITLSQSEPFLGQLQDAFVIRGRFYPIQQRQEIPGEIGIEIVVVHAAIKSPSVYRAPRQSWMETWGPAKPYIEPL